MNEAAEIVSTVLFFDYLEARTVRLAIYFACLDTASFSDAFSVVLTMLVLILYLSS